MRTISPAALLLCAGALVFVTPTCSAADEPGQNGKEKTSQRQTKLEQAFAEKLTGSTLVGTFSVDGSDKAPQEERYHLQKVGKLPNGLWQFTAGIRYGDTDVNVPLVLEVVWADDTPVISLTDFTIPGMGTFTSRVMFYGDRYAGTWQHGKAGGHMWGMIEKDKPTETPEPAAE